MTTVIIPAYNEAATIERTLRSVLDSAEGTDAEIIVVCNGCTDDTIERSRQFAPRVRVIETAVGSKTNALNLGDDDATSFPRIYLDADVVVSKSLIRDLTQALDVAEPRVAYPEVEYDLACSTRAVRAFYDVWRLMPYNRPGRIGVGVYALNRSGRNRFGRFPALISDDGFVRGQFDASECCIVNSCTTTVQAPATLTALVKIKTRSRLGLYQLRQQHPEVLKRHAAQKPFDATAGTYATDRRLAAGLPVYLLVNVVTRLRAVWQRRTLDRYRWERDETTRREFLMERVG